MKRSLLTCFFLCSVVSVYCQTEAQLKTQLKADPAFIKYNNARLEFITGIVENKWGFRNANKEMVKDISKKAKSYAEIKELYRKAGVDSGYLIAYNKLITTQGMVAKKYKSLIKSNPEMWKRVTKELTSSIPKPPPLNLRSKHSGVH